MAELELVLDCADVEAQAGFWAAALRYDRFGEAGQYRSIVPREGDTGPKLILQQVAEPKTGKNRMHVDVLADDIEAEAARLEGLGARRTRDEAFEEHGHRWIAMADPEGNEFCVCECSPPVRPQREF
jgi:predicted enzyme related to lactoylglutathione lyase